MDSPKETKRKVLTAMAVILITGTILIKFFIIPVGITLCAIIGLWYGVKYKDKVFVRWSSVGLIIGTGLIIYTLCLISSM